MLDTFEPFLLYPATGVQAVIANRDGANAIVIADNQGLFTAQPSGHEGGVLTDPNLTTIDAGGYLVVDGRSEVWAIAVAGTPVVSVTPGATAIVAGPAVIAAAITSSGIAAAIAQALAGTGVSLIGAAKLLYNVAPAPAQSSAAFVGATQGLSSGWWTVGPQISLQQAIQKWNGIVGAGFATLTTKVYFNPASGNNSGEYPYTPGTPPTLNSDTLHSLPFLAANNIKALLCVKPSSNGDNLTDLMTFLTACQLAGLKAEVVLYNEANRQITSTAYQATWAAYASTIRSATSSYGGTYTGYPCVHCPAIDNGTAGAPATLDAFFPTVHQVDKVYADMYEPAWIGNNGAGGKGQYDLSHVISQATTPPNGQTGPLPFGVAEFNGNMTVAGQARVQAFFNYVLATTQGIIAAGNPIADTLIFNGNGTLDAPLIQASSDARVNEAGTFQPDFQDIFSALNTIIPFTPFTVAPGAAALPPLTASPQAGYAIAGGISYDITITAIAGVSSTSPWLTVRLIWFNQDSVTALPVATQYWTVPMGASGSVGATTTGVGPQHGQFLKVQVFNQDSVTCQVQCQINVTGRNQGRHNWKWDTASTQAAGVTIPGYTLATGGRFANSLGSVNAVSVPASSTSTFLFGLFSGQAFFRFLAATGAGKMQVTLNPQPSSVWGSAALLNETPASGEFETMLVLPRGACEVFVTNSDTSAHVCDVQLIALD